MQKYENYWSTTLALTDFEGEKFNKCLEIIVTFLESNTEEFSQSKYKKLQESLNRYLDINEISVRKVINTYIKLGFIGFQLESIHEYAKEFYQTEDVEKKKILFSKVVYTNSSFNRSVTSDSTQHEMSFLIKTLTATELGRLEESDIIALMTINQISMYSKGYLNEDEIKKAKVYAKIINIEDRKYNQVRHLLSILDFLEDLTVEKDKDNNKYVIFEQDKDKYLLLERNKSSKSRDPYLHRLYKHELKKEVKGYDKTEKCMSEKLDYPSLIASHILPFRDSSNYQAYDVNNGLLLSRNMDNLFDQGYISFKDNGSIIVSDRLSLDLQKIVQNEKYHIDKHFLNADRLEYLKDHRQRHAFKVDNEL